MPTPQTPQRGDGYTRADGRHVDTEFVYLIPKGTALPAGQTIGLVWDVGDRSIARLLAEVTAKSGTNPTLDVTLQSSFDGVNDWRTMGTAFVQKTDVGLALSAVTAAGTSPPTVTFTGTPTVPINFRMECTTLGARGTAVVRTSIDGGVTWVSGITTAATFALTGSDGSSTGVTINYANATAATDNVWTGRSAGWERKDVALHGRFIRAVAQVGGTATPIMTAGVTGEVA
jgi:hypothetical protein